MKQDKYYSIKEVSNLLKVTYLTVYRWVKAKKLSAFKAGKQYRIKQDDLDSFFTSEGHK
ncbi:MAG: helix-turn-helix domain-containing protein [bacterium]|nr:helix-turn-helix domain-containing protein [bacterium]